MILRFDDLALKYKDYTDIKGKIRRQVASGELTQIARGLYETNPNTNGKYLAASIYGPSYLSFDYALAYYDLIPEAVYKTYTSATFRKGKSKTYTNHFGLFTFRDIPDAVYPLGIVLLEENGYSYQIASPEKAICDKLYSLSPVASVKELKALLFEDLRIDEDYFWRLDKNDINILAPLYRSTNLKLLLKLVNGGK
jgi:predicted transcriptional regulator of viral defense system